MNNLDFQHVQDDNFRSLVDALPRNVQAKVLKQFEYLMTIVQPPSFNHIHPSLCPSVHHLS